MKTFKTIEDYKKYINDFYDILQTNKNFIKENAVTMVFSSSINDESIDKQIIFGEPVIVGANLCTIIRKLDKDLVKYMFKALKKVK